MGILNVTPDSFADGGRYASTEAAIDRGMQLIQEGVDIIDVGGESTRPGAQRVSAEEELLRVLPVVEALGNHAVISIDTTRADVARASIEIGARLVNDISGGRYDEKMLATVAHLNAPYISMHSRGDAQTMNSLSKYENVVQDVRDELQLRVDAALAAGINESNLIIDPGLGFAKDAEQNWEMLRNLESFQSLGYPMLVGGSRKRFLGALIGSDIPDDREPASIALTALLAKSRVWAVRVHGGKAHVDAVKVAGRM